MGPGTEDITRFWATEDNNCVRQQLISAGNRVGGVEMERKMVNLVLTSTY